MYLYPKIWGKKRSMHGELTECFWKTPNGVSFTSKTIITTYDIYYIKNSSKRLMQLVVAYGMTGPFKFNLSRSFFTSQSFPERFYVYSQKD